MKLCKNCGEEILDNTYKCPSCKTIQIEGPEGIQIREKPLDLKSYQVEEKILLELEKLTEHSAVIRKYIRTIYWIILGPIIFYTISVIWSFLKNR